MHWLHHSDLTVKSKMLQESSFNVLFQGIEGKYITTLPLSDQYAQRDFRVDQTLGKSTKCTNFDMLYHIEGSVINKSALGQVMAWCLCSTKPLLEAVFSKIPVTIWHHYTTINVLIGPWEIWMKFYVLNFPDNFSDWWLKYLLWTCP